ncbi:MAG TPA: NAD(P)-binding domain-containing protein [Actinophytocola sp.]|jgi:thioredoxin reductase|uniref:NAD(P)-binding domain-containing protein n=1 Tax=Actinophytocola sp. TaxID=1872138 RepID=UPI002DFC0C10|nr:NAD(P)-binding domain-containing protein [Actinophytocola sp.]
MNNTQELPVAVIGAGPVGLAAAAHLAERAIPFVVLEAGDQAGAAIAQWGHVRLFSPWRHNIDRAARDLLRTTGWTEPDPRYLPTGAELVTGYLEPLAAHPAIAPALRVGARVEAISRLGYDRVRSHGREHAPFVLRVRAEDGTVSELTARAVIDASGTWLTPNTLGATGLPAHGETGATELIISALPDVLGADRDRFVNRHTVVLGAGHSATTTLLALAALAHTAPRTTVTWAIRAGDANRAYGGGAADALPARGAIGTRVRELVRAGRIQLITGFFTHTVHPRPDGVDLVSQDPAGVEQKLGADLVVNATGFRPDHTIAAELRLDLDPILGATRALAPLIDPNIHSCGTVPPHGVDELAHPEPGYHAIGVKSYGRAPTFLLATGYEQARSVVAALAGDWAAARDVQLELPETGVCSTNLTPARPGHGLATGISGGLLATPLLDTTSACCG